MELFKLLGTIAINNNEANKAIDETTGNAESASSKIGKAFGTIGKFATAAVAAGVAAAGALTKAAVAGYADYEQLVGGVDTLFKDSSKMVQEYADNAYKTAGMSANAYMETVTSFSASLLQSLGGDTEKAAQKADQAIIDMSDNANKMGTSIDMIQNAYQGFAKQNYTMLDNLKLGYGGTQQEMQRLLDDAERLTGIKYDISSYADVVDAIHAIQEEMGIAGTTAKEASSTIQGSALAMKAAWQNVLVGLADPEQDMDKLLTNLGDSIITFKDNILPRIQTTLEGISGFITKFAPTIIGDLVPAIMSALPGVIQAGVAIVGALASSIIESLPELLKPENIEMLIDCALNLIQALADGLLVALPVLVEALPEIILALVNGLLNGDNLGKIIETGVELTIALIDGLLQAMPALIDAIPQIVSAIANALTGYDWIALGGRLLDMLGEGFMSMTDSIVDILNSLLLAWTNCFNIGYDKINELTGGLLDKISGIWKKNLESIGNLAKNALDLMFDIFNNRIDKIKNTVESGINLIKNLFNFEWKLPDIKLPHFKISGDFSLNPPSVPELGVEWYAKGAVLTDPTVFGINGNKLMVGGEAGDEAIAPIDTLQGYVAEAVASQNAGLIAILEKILLAILKMDENMPDSLKKALEGMAFELNNREFARLVKAVN